MNSWSKRQIFLVVLAVAFVVGLIIFLTAPAPVSHPLQLSILGQTNDASGVSMTIVGVTNHTGQARRFYLGTLVPSPEGGWTSANQRCQKTGRLPAHSECQVLLLAPKGEARWKFSCMSMPDVTAPEWLWYRIVRQTGLTRLRLRDQPTESYAWTSEMRQ